MYSYDDKRTDRILLGTLALGVGAVALWENRTKIAAYAARQLEQRGTKAWLRLHGGEEHAPKVVEDMATQLGRELGARGGILGRIREEVIRTAREASFIRMAKGADIPEAVYSHAGRINFLMGRGVTQDKIASAQFIKDIVKDHKIWNEPDRLAEALMNIRARVSDPKDVEHLMAGAGGIEATVQKFMVEHLRNLGTPSRFDQMMEAVGVRRARVGKIKPGDYGGLREQLQEIWGGRALPPEAEQALQNIPIGRTFEVGGQRYDLSNAGFFAQKALNWTQRNVGVPVLPWLAFNPLSMGTWLAGRSPRAIIQIGTTAAQPLIADLLHRDPAAGTRSALFGIGKRFMQIMATPTAEGATVAAEELEGTFSAKVASHGFWRNILENMDQYQQSISAAAGAGGAASNPILRSLEFMGFNTKGFPEGAWAKTKHFFGLGTDIHQQNILAGMKSRFGKFTDPRWDPEAIRRMFEEGGELTREGAGHLSRILLEHGEIPGNYYGTFLGEVGDEAFGLLEGETREAAKRVMAGLATDQGTIDALNFLSVHHVGLGATTPELAALIERYRAAPRETLLEEPLGKIRNRILDNYIVRGLTNLEPMGAEGGGVVNFPKLKEIIGAGIADDETKQLARARAAGSVLDYVTQLGLEDVPLDRRILDDFTKESGFLKGAAEAALNNIPTIGTADRAGLTSAWRAPSEWGGIGSETLLMRERIPLGSALTEAMGPEGNTQQLNQWLKQYGAFFTGIKKPENFTETSAIGYFFAERLNRMFAGGGMGIPPSMMYSGGGIMLGIMATRLLPMYLGLEAWKYINYETDHGPSKMAANLKARAMLAGSYIGDYTGITGIKKKMLDIFPGMDQYSTPRSVDEMEAYLDKGYDAVRRGRYWVFGSRSPFVGGRIEEWRPSFYRRWRSGWSEAAGLADSEYFANAPYPSPRYPMAPLRHFFLSPYWFEERYAEERPALVSAPLFSPNTPHGLILNPTLGWLLKPPKILHPEYVPEALGGNLSKAEIQNLNQQMKVGGAGGGIGLGGLASSLVGWLTGTGGEGGGGGGLSSIGVISPGGSIVPVGTSFGRGGGGGMPGPGSKGGKLARWQITQMNKNLQALGDYLIPLSPSMDDPNASMDADVIADLSGPYSNLRTGLYLAQEQAGIYGWMASVAIGGQSPQGRILQTARGLDIERQWYEYANVGGIGGGVNEVLRRFIPHRQRSLEEWNPVPNRMPGWLPGSDYFLSLKTGDPYCVSPDTLVEVGSLQFIPASEVVVGESITSHLGQKQCVSKVATRSIKDGEGVFRLKVTSLAGVNLKFSEEHPILIVENPTQRRRYNPEVKVNRYRLANQILVLLEQGVVHKKELGQKVGLSLPYLSHILDLLEKDGKVVRNQKRLPVTLLDPTPYALTELESGLKWVKVKDLKPGQYVAYPRPKPQTQELTLDIGELTGYPSTERWVYRSGLVNPSGGFPESYEWLEEHPGTEFSWGERRDFLAEKGWSTRAFEHAQAAHKSESGVERIPRSVQLTEDLAYAFGLYLAEGSTGNAYVHYALHISEAAMFDRALHGAQSIDPSARGTFKSINGTSGAMSWIFNSPFQRVVTSLFGCGAHSKRIPDEFTHLTDQCLAVFLRGLFDGDGCYFLGRGGDYGEEGKRWTISLSSCNLVMLLQVRKLLLRWGVVASVTSKDSKGRIAFLQNGQRITGGENWNLLVRGGEAVRLAKILGYDVPETEYQSSRWTFVTDDYVLLRVLEVEELPTGSVPEVIGFEVGTDNSFCVAGIATHNTRVNRGEYRLPGKAYESIHDTKLMYLRASSLGQPVSEMMLAMLHIETPSTRYIQEIERQGTIAHRKIQNFWKRRGMLVGSEVSVENDEIGMTGHVDAILRMAGGATIGEIKTMSAKRYTAALAKGEPYREHEAQTLAYEYMTGINQGALFYVNREDPSQVHVFDVPFSGWRFKRYLNELTTARSNLAGMIDTGQISRGDLYPLVDRLEILAGTAPWSSEYTAMREALEHNPDLTPEEHDEVVAIKKRVTQMKKRYRLYPYKFSGSEYKRSVYEVVDIIDPNTLSVRNKLKPWEDPHPLRMSGVRASMAAATAAGFTAEGEELSPIEQIWAHMGIKVGSTISAITEGDPLYSTYDDVLRTERGVIYTKWGANVNRAMLKAGYAKEKEGDYSDTGVIARFTWPERVVGKVGEAFAHLDTPFHTKVYRVRSPLEVYLREQVYGTAAGSWNHPFSSYVYPSMVAYASRNPIGAAAGGAMFAAMFGTNWPTRFKLAKYGAIAMAGLSTLRMMYYGNAWIPHNVRRRRDTEEWVDLLKYIKARGLAAYAESMAKREENTDLDAMMDKARGIGEARKRKRQALSQWKLDLKLHHGDEPETARKLAFINDRLSNMTEQQGYRELGPWTTLAIQYRRMYQSTMYGAASEGPWVNVFRGLPKYERELMPGFIEDSSAKERRRIYELLPDYEKRLLGPKMGFKNPPVRPTLRELFSKKYQLPPSSWAGWSPSIDLEDVKAKVIRGEGLDPMDFLVYPQQEHEAEENLRDIPIPTIYGSSSHLQDELNKLLSGKGFDNIKVKVEQQGSDAPEYNVNLNLRMARDTDLVAATQKYA